jgi:hypothetical protein
MGMLYSEMSACPVGSTPPECSTRSCDRCFRIDATAALPATRATAEAARIVLDCYDKALADPQVKISTLLHAALLNLRKAMEAK